ncbi:MAG: caspase family protein, partial [Desulfobacteraceae bacterium]|nr:caspase family protein [Desulfobacteraceae bacterium]
MKKTAFFVLICFSITVMMAYAQNRGIKRIRKISDLSHQSNKLGAYHALIIGIDDYKDTKIPDLSSARKDAEAVAALLRNRYGFQTETLLDRQASKKAIFNALRSLATSTEENDSVLIYFAGHGDIDKIY